MTLFISIFGPDGSGKSTQARILAKHLVNRGLKVKLVWIKSRHTLAYIISRVFAKLSPRFLVLNPHGTIIRINAINNNPIGRLIWPWIEFMSILPLVILRVYLPLLMGYVIVAERYMVDSVVSIAYWLNDSNFLSSFIARTMLRLIPKRSMLVYLYSDYEEIRRRRGNMADPKDYVCFQKLAYNKLARMLGAIRIDTSQRSIEGTASAIRDHLKQAYGI
ncbi:MAG: hypothetical protein QXS32_07580 [Candidatus Nezhaarchaeales archaeon]